MDTGRGSMGQDQSGGRGKGVQDPSTCCWWFDCEERKSGTKHHIHILPLVTMYRKDRKNPPTPTPNLSKEDSLWFRLHSLMGHEIGSVSLQSPCPSVTVKGTVSLPGLLP